METREQILRRDFSDEFIAKMKNAIEVSHYNMDGVLKRIRN